MGIIAPGIWSKEGHWFNSIVVNQSQPSSKTHESGGRCAAFPAWPSRAGSLIWIESYALFLLVPSAASLPWARQKACLIYSAEGVEVWPVSFVVGRRALIIAGSVPTLWFEIALPGRGRLGLRLGQGGRRGG